MLIRRVFLAALAPVLLAGCGAGDALTPTADHPLVVTGYAEAGGASTSTITRDGDLVDVVGVDGVTLSSARSVGPVGSDARRLRDAAVHAHRRAVLLVSNYSDRINDFDEPLAHRMLGSASNRAAVVRALVSRASGFHGVQVDLESLRARDVAGLTAFTRALRRALPHQQLSMAFMASRDASGYRSRGYDLSALAKVLDVAALMTYDDHGPWSSAGPIAPMPWVRSELRYFLTRVPRSKVDLGAAAYGYRWGGGSPELTVPAARRLAGSAARWQATDGEWYARLPHGRNLWWDDVRSLRLRLDLARREHLHGVAIWQLGSSGDLS